VTRSLLPLEAESGAVHVDPRCIPWRIELIHSRREDKVDARPGRDARVARLVAG
jgi:hypothetical protein